MVRIENTFLLLLLFCLLELRKRSSGLYYAAPSVKHFRSSAGTKDSIDSNND